MSIKIYVKYVKNNRDFYTTKMNLPTGALDSENTESLMRLLQKLNETGITMIIVTHNPVVAKMCKKRYVLTDGKLVEEEAN